MSTANPEWVDDHMALADAVGVTRPEPLHPSVRGHLADASLADVLESWSAAAAGIDVDEPIPFTPTDKPVEELAGVECEYCGGDRCREYLIQGEQVDRLCTWCGGTGVRQDLDRGGEL